MNTRGTPMESEDWYLSRGQERLGPYPVDTLRQWAASAHLLPEDKVWCGGWAIAAGYLGLVSVLVFPAPLALIAAIFAIIDIRKDPDKHGMGRAIFGLIMGIIFSVVLAFVVFAITRDL